jgi:hypothetical protein
MDRSGAGMAEGVTETYSDGIRKLTKRLTALIGK